MKTSKSRSARKPRAVLSALALLGILPVVGSAPARASEAFTIESYGVRVRLSEDSVLDVDETLNVHFLEPRHGIFRKIPIRYSVDRSSAPGDRAERPWIANGEYSYSVTDVRVSGHPFKVTTEGRNLVIRIGSADSLVDGDVTYPIHYRIYGAVNFFRDHSELYWNLIGNQWDAPIRSASYSISLPGAWSPSPSDYFVVGGAYGSKEKVASIDVGPSRVSGELLRPLGPREGLTIGLRFPEGYLKRGGFWQKLRLILANDPWLPLPIFVAVLCFLLWRWIGKDYGVATVVQWKAPEGVTPAEAGYVWGEDASPRFLTAMIIHWAAHGFLTIAEDSPGILGFGKSYVLTRASPLPSTAKSYEKTLFNGLFVGESGSVSTDSLKNRFYPTLQTAIAELKAEGAPYFETGSMVVRNVMRFLAVAISALGVGTFLYHVLSIDRALMLIACSIPIWFFGKYMAKKSRVGLDLYRRLLGFREFIHRVERPRLEAIQKEDTEYFDRTLAYAIVLGVGEEWAGKFDGLLSEPPRWYVGANPMAFSTRSFASSIDRGVSAMAETFASQPGGSGGSGFGGGGGGFSGGGGGGGGGGSW